MRCAPWLLGSLTVALIAGCGGDRRNNDNSAAGTGTETGTMQGGAATTDTAMSGGGTSGMSQGMRSDTGMSHGMSSDSSMSQGMSSDTAHADAGMHGNMNRSSTGSDSAKGNQTKSGVTNTKTGKSTLGKGVTKTRPDQGQPVTSKGDTVSSGPDSTGGNR